MATPQNSGNTPARSNESTIQAETEFIRSLEEQKLLQADPQLADAIQTAGEDPTRAAELAAELGLSHADQKRSQPPAAPEQKPESVLHQALRRTNIPPPEHDHWFDMPPAGAFDAGFARAMAESDLAGFEAFARRCGARFGGTPMDDVVERLGEEAKNSFGFARFAMSLAGGIRLNQEEGDGEEELQQHAEYELARMAGTLFLAGWLMGQENRNAHYDARRMKGESGAAA